MLDSLALRPTGSLEAVRDALEQPTARDPAGRGERSTRLEHIPAREAQWFLMPDWVLPELAAAYRAKAISRLYTHQAAAAEGARAGKNMVVVTPTSSGKTLCYNLPVRSEEHTSGL